MRMQFGGFHLLTPVEMARADRLAPLAGPLLMERAGWAVVQAVVTMGPQRVLVLCGPGNNGGDGYVAARLLAARGWPVRVAALAAPKAGSEAEGAATQYIQSVGNGMMVSFTADEVGRADLVIDALFGAGLDRDLSADVVNVLRAAKRVVAVDVPSGMDGVTGMARGFAPQALKTVTFFRAKPGHLLLPGRDLCGELVVADIGIPERVLAEIKPTHFINQPGLWSLPVLAVDGHKYGRGSLTVVGGATTTGAARLVAAGARGAGVGLVTIAALGNGDVYRTGDPGVMVSDETPDVLALDQRRRVWVTGPGMGIEAARKFVPELLLAGRALVVDADALTAFAGAPESLGGAAVITPHAAEFSRLFGPPSADRTASVRAAARYTGAVVVLKGSDTIIAAPDGRVAINCDAPPSLATAGSGDVLAGIVGGLIAQGMGYFDAACAGVWLHGCAASLVGSGLLAEDLPRAVPLAIREAQKYIVRYCG